MKEKNIHWLQEIFKDIEHSIPDDGVAVEECSRCNAVGEVLIYGDWVTCDKCWGDCYFPINDVKKSK